MTTCGVLRDFKVGWTLQEGPICHCVGGSLLYQNQLPTILLNSFQLLQTGFFGVWEQITNLSYIPSTDASLKIDEVKSRLLVQSAVKTTIDDQE